MESKSWNAGISVLSGRARWPVGRSVGWTDLFTGVLLFERLSCLSPELSLLTVSVSPSREHMSRHRDHWPTGI